MKAEVYFFGSHLGTLIEDGQRTAFGYAADYMGPSPSPLVMPTGPLKPFYPRTGEALPSVFADSLPDAYGNSALDRWFRESGLNPDKITPVERLCYLGDRCFGALTYKPDLGSTHKEIIRAITEIDIERNAMITQSGVPEQIDPQFLEAASSPGGARPKIAVGMSREGGWNLVIGDWQKHLDQYAPAILKIDIGKNREYGRIEAAYLSMAAAAGINVAPHFLFEQAGKAHFVTKRFDWDGVNRLHLHTVAGLLDRDFNLNNTSYKEILILAKRLTGSISASEEYFRRAVFNYMSANCDDHAKNHSFLMNQVGIWRPSPAYDLTPSQGPGRRGHHATVLGFNFAASPGMKEFVGLGQAVGINLARIHETVDQVRAAINDWSRFADKWGVSSSRMSDIATLHQKTI